MKKIIDSIAINMNDETKELFEKYFTESYLKKNSPPVVTIDDIRHVIPYVPIPATFRTSIHIGQRKLFLSELQFIVDYCKNDKEILCVYAGAAPNNKGGLLSKLLPNVKWLLVDPNKFEVFNAKVNILVHKDNPIESLEKAKEIINEVMKGDDKIYIINDLFTINLATAIKEIVPRDILYFISDIRTNVSNNPSVESPDTTDILWNLSQQYNWMCIMQPVQSMVKFRHPFYAEDPEIFEKRCVQSPYKEDFELSKANGIDFIEIFRSKKLIYWDGVINVQAFAGVSSAETRLITDSINTKDYGTPDEYEGKMFYFNSIARWAEDHFNNNADKKLGFDHCNDCALENLIWRKYIAKYKSSSTVKELVAELSKITHRWLIRDDHGQFFGPYPAQKLIKTINEYNLENK